MDLMETDSRDGYVAELVTDYIDMTGMCVELFFWPVAEAGSLSRPVVSVLALSEENRRITVAQSTGFELPMWNRLFGQLPGGIHRLIVSGRRSTGDRSGLSIDDIVVQTCTKFGKV